MAVKTKPVLWTVVVFVALATPSLLVTGKPNNTIATPLRTGINDTLKLTFYTGNGTCIAWGHQCRYGMPLSTVKCEPGQGSMEYEKDAIPTVLATSALGQCPCTVQEEGPKERQTMEVDRVLAMQNAHRHSSERCGVVTAVCLTAAQALLARFSAKSREGTNVMLRVSTAMNVCLLAMVLLVSELATLILCLHSWFGGASSGVSLAAVVMIGHTLPVLFKACATRHFRITRATILSAATRQFGAAIFPLLSNEWALKAVLAEYKTTSQAKTVSGPPRQVHRWDPILEPKRLLVAVYSLVTNDIPELLQLVMEDVRSSGQIHSIWSWIQPWKIAAVLRKRYKRRMRIWRHSDWHPSNVRSRHGLSSTWWMLRRIEGKQCDNNLNDSIEKSLLFAPFDCQVPSWQLSGLTVRTPTWLTQESYISDYWGMVMRELAGKETFIKDLKDGSKDWAGLTDGGSNWDLEDPADVSEEEAGLIWRELQVRHDIKSIVERVSNCVRLWNPATFISKAAVHGAMKTTGALCALSMSQALFDHLMDAMDGADSDPDYTDAFIWMNALSLIPARLHMKSCAGSGLVREHFMSARGRNLYRKWLREVNDRPTTYRTQRAVSIMQSTLAGGPEWKEGVGDELSNLSLEWWGRRSLQVEREGVGENGILEQIILLTAMDVVGEALESAVRKRTGTGATYQLGSGALLAAQMKQAYALLYLNMDLPSSMSAIDLTLILYHILFLVVHVDEEFDTPNAITNRRTYKSDSGTRDEVAASVFLKEARNWLKVPCPIPVWTESPGEWRPWRLYRSPLDEIAAVYKIPNPGVVSLWEPYKLPGMHCDTLLGFLDHVQQQRSCRGGEAPDSGRGRAGECAADRKSVRELWREAGRRRGEPEQTKVTLKVKVRNAFSTSTSCTVPDTFPATRDTYRSYAHLSYEILTNSVMQREVKAANAAEGEAEKSLVIPSQHELEVMKGQSLIPGEEGWKRRSLEESLLKLGEVGLGNEALERDDAHKSIETMVKFLESSGVSLYLVAESIVGNFLEFSGSKSWAGKKAGEDSNNYEQVAQLELRIANHTSLRDWARDLSFRTGFERKQARMEMTGAVLNASQGITLDNISKGCKFSLTADCHTGGWRTTGWKYE
eukprot:evm.model.scf_489.8 EVM.evm.TU.scf_489.8   scf_489:63111-68242(-)